MSILHKKWYCYLGFFWNNFVSFLFYYYRNEFPVSALYTIVIWMCSQKYLIYRYRTRAGNDERYKIQLIAGYAVPLLFVILAVIVEASAPRCSKWKPRFLEGTCFFAGIVLISNKHELPISNIKLRLRLSMLESSYTGRGSISKQTDCSSNFWLDTHTR